MDIYEAARTVKDRATFVAFARYLSRNVVEESDEWENLTLTDYFGAMAAALEGDRFPQPRSDDDYRVPEDFDWKYAARVLTEGIKYE